MALLTRLGFGGHLISSLVLPVDLLASKLKNLKPDLKEWNAKVFWNINGQENSLTEECQILESWKEDGAFSEEAFFRKNLLWLLILRVLLMEEIS